jgi:putative membrane protein
MIENGKFNLKLAKKNMHIYEPKDWFTFIFKVHKSETFKKLIPMIIFIGCYTAIIVWAEYEWWHWEKDPFIKNLTTVQTLLGFVLSLLLVFRTNTAYDRWWEGRKLWGTLVNNSRTLSLKLNALLPDEDQENRLFFQRGISHYAHGLKQHLRSRNLEIELDDDWKEMIGHDHIPNQIASKMFQRVYTLEKAGKINGFEFQSLQVEISEFQNICGGCERIRNTPIPFSYNVFVKKFIFFYVMTLPFGYAIQLHWLCIALSCIVFYALASLEVIAEEIEDPFGNDSNDIPTDRICETIDNNTKQILRVN